MLNLNVYLLLTFLLCLSAHAKFPVDPTPCKYGDLDCVTKTIEYLLHDKSDGEGSINLVKIDPLEIKKIEIKQGAESPVNIDLEFDQNKIYGLKNSKVISVTGFGKDMTQKHDLVLTIPQVDLVGKYKVNGRILLLPIVGSGNSNITLYDLELKLQFTGAPIENNGETYLKVEQFRFNLEPKKMTFQIDNLFNGDKILGDNMNVFLNENWIPIYAELRGSIATAFGKIFRSVIAHVFTKYPYDKYFSE